jgi:uncharacterized protein (DUF1684 family)
MDEALELADWRRRTAALYLDEPAEGAEGALAWRRGRDAMFRDHPQSALPDEMRAGFTGLPYWDYDQAAVVTAPLTAPEDDTGLEIETGGEDGLLRYRRAGRVATPWGGLTLFWLLGYGGGLFLPFRDATSGQGSYGGGRYLTDTIKGTHGRGVVVGDDGMVTLDFNYAYNPSCAYNPRWACPLAPPENHLDGAVEAGERILAAT